MVNAAPEGTRRVGRPELIWEERVREDEERRRRAGAFVRGSRGDSAAGPLSSVFCVGGAFRLAAAGVAALTPLLFAEELRVAPRAVEGTAELPAASRALFLEKARQSNAACQAGDYATAVALYTDALQLDPTNHILYSNRSAALVKMGQFAQALQDAIRARELNTKWPKAYYRQGVALQCLGRHGDALAAFSSGLAQDPKSTQLLAGLVEASMKSPLRATLEPTFRQLEAMKLDKSPFVIISVVGQELLAVGQYAAAVVVLEAALRIGTCSLKLRGSVFSALSSAYWALNSLDKAISYMQQDLAVAKTLGDIAGECRAHGNLGSAYFSKGSYKEALTSHRYQLVLAMKCKDTQAAAAALTSLGHVYTAIGDYPNALASHKQCVQLVKQMGDRLQEAREIGNVGAVYLAMGEFESAVDCHTQHLRLARRLGNQVEEARAYSNLGSSHHYRRNFGQAIAFHENVLRIAQELGDRAVEARAYAGLGHAARCAGDYAQAKRWHERQLDMALASRDKVGEGRACSNLGIVYQLLGEHDAALKLHQAHLSIARQLHDRAGMGRAYGNIGNAYSAMGYYEQAIKYHKQELTISKEVNDRSSEASTHGNLAVAYQALGAHEMALLHYRAHLNTARELKDTAGEACALLNLANCLSSRGEFAQAVPFYENYLMLSQELHDIEGESKACHFLGYAHYCLGNYREAVRYYDQDLALAKDLQDKMNMGRAYCNLGLAHLALGNLETALECQKYFLAIAHMMKHLPGKFRALGNIGDVLIKMGDVEEAVKMYQRQLTFARQGRDRGLEAAAYGALGLGHRLLRCFDKALGYHTQELTLRQEMGDLKGECRAHGHLGAVHMSLGNYTNAMKCYQEQLERAKELKDNAVEAQAFGNLGIARLNMGHYEDAIGYLEQQLATLEQLSSSTALLDKGRAFGNLGDCYDALGDFEEAVKCHEQHLSIGLKLKSLRDQERAYRGLGHSHKCLGNLQQALVCFEKRLVVAHELGSPEAKASAYGELGHIHSTLGHFEQAISCLEHQLAIARELKDKVAEADAACGLGTVYQQMGEYATALRYHQADLDTAEELGLAALQGRACGNLGTVHESLGNFEEAVRYQEQHLSIAAQTNDKLAKTMAYSSLGRIHHALGNTSQAVAYLQQGLQIAEHLGRREEEARIRHRLGLALWGHGDLEGSQSQLERAAALLETIRREARGSPDYKLSLYDLQTASYQALQRVLVGLGRQEEALLVAERGRTRAGSAPAPRLDDNTPNSVEQLLEIVNRQKASVLYYSLAAGYLYSWLIVPTKGVVRFHEVAVSEVEAEREQEANGEELLATSGSLLEHYIQSVRDSLGVELHTMSRGRGIMGDMDADASDIWSQHLEELGDRLNQDADRTGFLRMVNRNHLFNSSNYSLSSLFSLGSVGGSVASGPASRPGSTRSRQPPHQSWQGPSCLAALYQLLLAPFEDCLPSLCAKGSKGRRELLLVLEGELYLVPFPVLKPATEGPCEYLCERFSLLVVPSLSSLRASQRSSRALTASKASPAGSTVTAAPGMDQTQQSTNMSALVVGNPRLPGSVTEQWGWSDIPYAEQEAAMVAEMLQAKALVGAQASKEAVLRQIGEAECVHLATHVSWKLSAIVLSPGDVVDSQQPKRYFATAGSDPGHEQGDEEGSEVSSTTELPAPSEFLLTAADLLQLRLSARLVVVSSSHTRDHHGWASADGVVGLTRALLAAGAQCVLVSLWPVPDTAARLLLRAFYSALLQGSRVSKALAEAMLTVQHTKHFAHPANWAGFLLVGTDVRLSNKVALMGQALCELLKSPDKCRDALRVTLHLVEKSLQRIHRGQKNAMYTTQKSIENKVGHVNGWKELLMSVGFRFEPAANGIPSSVFFPQSDPEERLTQCSASLQALLGLTGTSLYALSKLMSNVEVADDIIGVIRQVIGQFSMKNPETDSVEIPISVKLWRVPGCHELLASLGFDLMEVGQDEVTLRTGKQANRRNIQFVLQALLALFDTQEAPKSLSLDSSSSLESLTSLDGEDERVGGGSGGLRSRSPPPVAMPPPPLPFSLLPGHRSTGGAFTSYVRRRGEPDGHTACAPETVTAATVTANTSSTTSTAAAPPAKPTIVGRPGGGGESDAAFTPSPPVVQDIATLTLAHQTRIRTLYSGNIAGSGKGGGGGGDGSPPSGETSVALLRCSRPASSSSASSATDWEGSGHNTVLRRAAQQMPLPPLPPPRQVPAPPAPVVEALHPLPPSTLYNPGGESQHSSDSDFGSPVKSVFKTTRSNYHNAPTLKLQSTSATSSVQNPQQASMLERLSVRTELGNLGSAGSRKPLALSSGDEGTLPNIKDSSSRIHYFPVADSNDTSESKTFEETPDVMASNSNNASSSSTQNNNSNSIQDQIIATQLRRLNRELTPTISDVYHERNIGLGLAPPLSKLLLPSRQAAGTVGAKENQQHGNEVESGTGEALLAAGLDKLGLLSEESKSGTDTSTSKAPWLSLQQFQQSGGDLSTADLLAESKVRATGGSPCSELSRRDEGDGRSIADSQCSAGSYNKPSLLTRANPGIYFGQDDQKMQPARVVSFLEDVVSMGADECGGSSKSRGASRDSNTAPLPRLRASKQPPPPIPTSRPPPTSVKFPGGFGHQQQPPSQC
ncbi:tetratricopeptide repeat protein 28 [Schistocerca cancellata]|uniref:tetratricopeptide repeat protein 28 n=1 Tax=Schistocerca cancellata TaxID=274614 RepID=UPI0021186CE7|nr:tetratricopeptide repeat protein 28 [Schistocerca cancellata]